jgi:hypothetical protein
VIDASVSLQACRNRPLWMRKGSGSLRLDGPFNVIYMPVAFRFDFFSARVFALGVQELERAGSGLGQPGPKILLL